MDALVLSLVLTAALLHATWNAMIKHGGDPLTRLAINIFTCGLMGLPLLPFVSAPAPESWPFLFGSVVVHNLYYFFLIHSYRVGDLSLIYPIARGVAPPIVALTAYIFADERLSAAGIFAVSFICLAILSLARDGRHQHGAKPILLALCTGCTIAGYTLLDGLGGRASGDVFGYIAYLFVIEMLPLTLITLYFRRRHLRTVLRENWGTGVLSGVMSGGGFAVIIWAMSLTPMTYVSALRETSVIAAALIGTLVLKEPLGARRLAAASMVGAGVVLLQLTR